MLIEILFFNRKLVRILTPRWVETTIFAWEMILHVLKKTMFYVEESLYLKKKILIWLRLLFIH